LNSLQQHINKIAEMFFRLGGETAVICPGSRNAPLTVAFARHQKINCIPVSDERSAAFIALGIAQQTKKPVALICTSGTATLNFYPAICEAFYQNVPLVVITADRPPELIDQWDGQAIRQNDVFKNHILKQITIPNALNEDSMLSMEKDLKDVIELCIQQNLPVHINVPLNEPFYPSVEEKYFYDEQKIIPGNASLLPMHASEKDVHEIADVIKQIQNQGDNSDSLKLLVIIGFNHFDQEVSEAVHKAQQKLNFPIIADIISNYNFDNAIKNYDFILDEKNNAEELHPDVLITIGAALLSKNIKKYIQKHKPRKHIHIQAYGHVGNPFQTLTGILRVKPELFFAVLSKLDMNASSYLNAWKSRDEKIAIKKEIQNLPFCELKAAGIILKALPTHSNLQLANSMSVRYPMLLGIDKTIKINCNRGTSGIDGCSSTAVGAASVSDKITTLITGDIAFFYDVNAFWNIIALPKLRIIILNNGGGGIFRLIDGPSKLEELEVFFENSHARTATHIARDFNFQYLHAANEKGLEEALHGFYEESNRPKILEIFTDKYVNEKEFKKWRMENGELRIEN
jgi:2-succinyl-5-enolpyruvyl-6-hydroxy-3-cyclohexene-1-carboxylate synthase